MSGIRLFVVLVLPCVFALSRLDISRTQHVSLNVWADINGMFEDFKRTHGKVYADEREEAIRREIFEDNANFINEHNRLYEAGRETYYLGVNQFSDLTHEEFVQTYLAKMSVPQVVKAEAIDSDYMPTTLPPLPYIIDWRDTGFVSEVMTQTTGTNRQAVLFLVKESQGENCAQTDTFDQTQAGQGRVWGPCAAGWAFSAAGALEGQHFNETRKLVPLSPQQLIDCTDHQGTGNFGCDGGEVINAFSYIELVGGMQSNEDYPYIAKASNCRFDRHKVEANMTGVRAIPSGNEYELLSAIYNIGPISVVINAGLRTFQSYKGGIYTDRNCDPSQVNHAVLAAGYGKDPHHYWLLKNSWGTLWGEDGYIKIARTGDNLCGVTVNPLVPLV